MLKFLHLPISFFIAVGLAIGTCHTNLFFLCTGLLFITVFFVKTQWSYKIFSALLFSIVLGYYLASLQRDNFDCFKSQINQQFFDITGTVVEYERIENSIFKHKLIIQASLLTNPNKQLLVNQKIAIYTQQYPRAYVGEQIILHNLRFNFSSDRHFQDYLIKNQLAASIFATSLDFKVLKTNNFFCLKQYKRRLLKKINLKMNTATKVMFNSIFAGYKNDHKTEFNLLKNEFQTWGIIHYLARSGLHLVIISAIWQTICTMIQIPALFSNLIVLIFMFLFCALTWPALPFIRALIMIACYRACHFLKLQVHLLHILNISCIYTLINNPISIFFLDFQLSFLLTYGLIFFNEISYMKNKQHANNSIDCRN